MGVRQGGEWWIGDRFHPWKWCRGNLWRGYVVVRCHPRKWYRVVWGSCWCFDVSDGWLDRWWLDRGWLDRGWCIGDVGEYVGELLEGSSLDECGWWKRCCVGRLEECSNEIGGGCGGEFEGGGCGHFDVGGKPGEGVGDAFGSGCIGPDSVAPIVLHCWADVPTFDGVGCPCFTEGGGFVDEDTGSGRGKRRSIEVEGAVNLGPSGEFRVDAGRSE